MARKSRYETTAEIAGATVWNAAGYGRLSVEDRGEADSLINQELMLRQHIERSPDMKLSRVFSDNGLTGTNFARPGFEALMDAVRRGTVNCIVVKDLSRFGRDYIEAGNFIETVFPSLGVRFVSINDGYDSNDPLCWDDGMSIALRNIVNAAYVKDISMKLRSAYDAKRSRGDFIGPKAPYGYTRLTEKKSQLVIDEEAAAVVREIFKLRIEGASLWEIALKLDAAGVPAPSHYAYIKGYRNDKRFAEPSLWNYSVILKILSNKVYIGHLELGKKKTVRMGVRVKQPKENWIFNKDMHDPIVSQADFDAVAEIALKQKQYREMMPKADRPPTPENIFAGIIFCGVCGRAFNRKSLTGMGRKQTLYYLCLSCQHHGISSKGKSFNSDELKSVVHQVILAQIKACADKAAVAERIRLSDPVIRRLAELHDELDKSQKRISFLEANEGRLLSDHYDGLLSKEEYQHVSKKRNDEKLARIAKCAELLTEMEQYTPGYWQSKKHVDVIEWFNNQPELTRDMLEALVERIEIDEGKKVTIRYKYQDEFAALEQFVDMNEGVIDAV